MSAEVLLAAVPSGAPSGAVLTDHVYPVLGLIAAVATLWVVVVLDSRAHALQKAWREETEHRLRRDRDMSLPTLIRDEADLDIVRGLLREAEASDSRASRGASQRAFWGRADTPVPTAADLRALEPAVVDHIAQELDTKFPVPNGEARRRASLFARACLGSDHLSAACRTIEWWVQRSARAGGIDRRPISEILDAFEPRAVQTLMYAAHAERRTCPSVFLDVLGEVTFWMVTQCDARPSMPAGDTRVPTPEGLDQIRRDPRLGETLRSFLTTWANLEPNGGMDDFWTLDEDDSAFRRHEIAVQAMALCAIAAPLEPHCGKRALQRAHTWRGNLASGDFDDDVYLELARREFAAALPSQWGHYSF